MGNKPSIVALAMMIDVVAVANEDDGMSEGRVSRGMLSRLPFSSRRGCSRRVLERRGLLVSRF